MNKHLTLHQTLSAILLFIGIALGQSAFAQTTWSLQPTSSGNTITYKVKRSGDISQAVTVRYRTVGLSSYEGENFTSANGTLTFPAGIDQQTVTVTTQTPSTEAYKYYQSGAARKYLFEVTDMGGFTLLSREDNAGAGTVFNTSYLNQSVTDLVYFNSNGAIKSGDGNKYVDASHSGSSDWVQVTESGYSQAVHTISTNNLYSNNSSDASFRSYLNAIGYNMYATVYFTQMEEQDGYQYIQILADNSTSYDGDDPDGKVNAPSTSLYKACFILSYDPSGSVMSDAHYQFFPHRYDYVDLAAEQTAGISHYEFDYDNSHLYQQKFRTTSYQASTSGSLVLAPTVNNLNVRFDAAGSGGDTWDFKNLKVRLALVDATKPTIRNNNDIRVADGAYGYGNTVYITIPFTEIVTVTGSPTLSTTWGTLNYVAGSGTNVLTFSGHIEADLGTVLTVNSIGGTSFTIKDLMGNTYNSTSINKTYSGLQVTNPWAGSGTANDPFIIMDRYQLDLLSKLVWAGNYYEDTYFKLGANITYSSSTSWSSTSSFTSNFTSIGGWGHSFRGIFDGDGHSISGIRIYKTGTANNDQCQGLFGMISTGSMVKNLVLYNANIVGYKQVGGITGSHSSGTIQDCYVYNTRAKASDTQCGIIRGSGSATVTRGYYKDCMVGSNTGQHNIVKLTLNDNATVSRTPVTTVNSTLTTYSDGATISGEEYYSPDATITLGYSSSVSSGSFVKYTASTSSGDITYTNIDGNVLTMPDADVTVSAAILPVVDYLDADGNAQQCSDYTVITGSDSNVELGASNKTHWYVVSSNATINAKIEFHDATANIILCDGTTLNVNRTNSGSAVFVNNLNIFGQTNGTGTLNVTSINGSALSPNALGIYGGIVSASGGDYGINAGSNSITLGYTAATNRITASSYNCSSLTVKAGQTLTDGEGHLYNGTYSGDDLYAALTAMATKTLQPAYSITLPANFTVTGTTAPQGYAPANEVVTLHTDEGYTITGASYTPAGGSATTINPVEGVWSFTMPAANTTVNATRVVNTYTVHFDANATNGIDVTGTMEDMDFTYGQAQNLTTNVFERTGYTFDGWNTAADGSGDAYTDGQNVNNLTNVLNGLVTLYAQWSVISWEGNGTSENDPFIIIYASQLVKLSEDVNGGKSYPNKFFKLGNDIDMNGVAFDGIGYSNFRSFIGTFDGDGKTVSNVIVNKSEQDYVGFFGNVRSGGTVKNLILDGVSIAGDTRVGALVGSGYNCSIENCLVMNSSVTCANLTFTGVICGYPDGATLTDNHYRNCTLTKGNNTSTINIGIGSFSSGSSDVDGARSIHTLALPEHVTATSDDMLTYDNVTYYASNVEVTLTPASGITLADVTVNGVAATHQQDETWTFTMPAADATVTCTSSVPYVDADGTQQTCSSYTVIESSQNSYGTSGQTGWYVVSGDVTINNNADALLLYGSDIYLILCDGAKLTLNSTGGRGLHVYNGNLTIFVQESGTGSIEAESYMASIQVQHNCTINGGNFDLESTNSYGLLISQGILTINGGNISATSTNANAIHTHNAGSNIIINGGIVNATTPAGGSYYGIKAEGNITLGFTNLTDRITASSYKAYNGTISVKASQALYDGTAVAYSGTLTNTQIDAIAGKTLQPCFILTLPAHVNATGVISQDGTTAYALAGNEITLAVTEGYEITSGAASLTMPTHNVVSDVTVQAIAYSISYDLAGGSVSTANPTEYTIETPDITLNNPTRPQFTFAGWTGTDLSEATLNVIIAQGSTGPRSYTANWSADIAENWGNGDGSLEAPYVITTTQGLDLLATLVNEGNTYEGKYFELGNDIDYVSNTTANYTAIGTQTCAFAGTFDGKGYAVKNFHIESNTGYQGLFGHVAESGTVKNVGVDNVVINDNAGIRNAGIVGLNWGSVENCLVINTVISGSWPEPIAGFAGTVTNSYYRNCTVGGWANQTNCYTITGDTGVTVAILDYDYGVMYDGTLYAPEGATVSLNLSYNNVPSGQVPVFYASSGQLSGTGNPYTLVMDYHEDATIGAMLGLANVAYLDADGVQQTCPAAIPITSGNANYPGGWFVVESDVTFNNDGGIGFHGDAHLIIADGVTLTSGFISNPYGSLTIYAQSGGDNMGVINATVAAIGLTINGGIINANQNNDSGLYSTRGDLVINSGRITANILVEYIVSKDVADIILGWRNTTDFITAGSYSCESGNVKVKAGQILTDGNNAYFGTLTADQVTAIAGQTLVPFQIGWEGNGTANAPYVIDTPEELNTLAMMVNGGEYFIDTYFELGADIAYEYTSDWDDTTSEENNFTAIGGGSNNCVFMGVFDGKGYTISGIRINKNEQCQGLFGMTLGAVIKNIVLTDTRIISNNSNIGGIVGLNQGTVENCLLINVLVRGNTNYNVIVGNNNDTVTNCYYRNCDGNGYKLSNAFTISAGEDVTVTVNSYNYGIEYNGTLYAPEDAEVSLNLGFTGNPTELGCYYASAGTLEGTENPYTLYMSDEDIIINARMRVPYIDANGQTAYCYNYIPLDGDNSVYGELGETWYVVDHDVTYNDRLSFLGDANLILVDGATLTINKEDDELDYGAMLSNSLTIYVQSEGTGAIVGVDSFMGSEESMTIHGGHITFTGQYGYIFSINDNMTINSGQISIDNEYYCLYAEGIITINGGTLDLHTTTYDVISGNGDVFINGGDITITTTGDGNGIVDNNVTINGGKVKVYVEDGYGISTSGTITLGWTDAANDLIMSENGFNAVDVMVATGQVFTDGTNYYVGTLTNDQLTALAGQTLVPYQISWAGEGTEEHPYIITTPAQLDWLSTMVNAGTPYENTYFELGNDIAYEYTSDWDDTSSEENNFTAIGSLNYCAFLGVFDGKGHAISGIRIYSNEGEQGLFGVTYNAVIRNITLTDTRITTVSAANVGGIVGVNQGTVENCHVTNTVNIHNVPVQVGGIVGLNTNNTIVRGCTSSVRLTIDNENYHGSYGGIVGSLGSGCTIEDCLAIDVINECTNSSGPIVGSGYGTVNNSYYYNCTVGSETNMSDIYALNHANNVTVALAGDVFIAYDYDGIAVYNYGYDYSMAYGGTLYAPGYAEVLLTLGYTGDPQTFGGYMASAGTLTGTENPYTLFMPYEDVIISARTSIPYIDADGQTAYCQNYTILDGSEDNISYGEDGVEAWYVVDHDVTYSGGIWIYGPANLILVDGATLTINNDEIYDSYGYMTTNNRLTIYVQSEGTGAINAVNSLISTYGLIIHGGHISFTGIDSERCYIYSDGDMTINGGEITIENLNNCIYVSDGDLTINGGTVNLSSGNSSYSVNTIDVDGDVVINGGEITVTNSYDGHGIAGNNITINGGKVTAYAEEGAGLYVDYHYDGTITLGWTDESDFITCNRYFYCNVIVVAGKAFTDGEGNYFAGTLDWDGIEAMWGKTLVPFTNLSETFNITYVTDGGTLPVGYPTTYTFGETVVLPIPTKTDNAFAGWYLDNDFVGEPITEITAGTMIGDKTFYAMWKPAKTWVKYLDADGIKQQAYATILYGIETDTLPGGIYTYLDYELFYDKLVFDGNTTIILPDGYDLYVECMGKGITDSENGLFVNGDLTIYGQEYGYGELCSYNVQASGDVAIYGGYTFIGYLSANNGNGTITLSWTGPDNGYYVMEYLGDVVLAKAFIDDDNIIYEAGPVEDVTTINDKWLYPCVTETEVSYLDENGVLQTTTAKVLYGGEEAKYPGGVYTVMAGYTKSNADYERLHFTGDATLILPDYGWLGVPAVKSDEDYWLIVEGDLTIYGQRYGNGGCMFINDTIHGDVNVYGGNVWLVNLNADNINLSWTAVNNDYFITPQTGTVNLLKDFVTNTPEGFEVIPSGDNIPYEVISDKEISPYAETVAVSYIDENGDTHTENATVLWGNETSLDGGTYTFIRDNFFNQISFSGDTKLIVPDEIDIYCNDVEDALSVNGDLAIYGQENLTGEIRFNATATGDVTVGNVYVYSSVINSGGNILIVGASQSYYHLRANGGNGIITLGYIHYGDIDCIRCNDYEGTVAIRAGQTMQEDWFEKTYSGTLTTEQVDEITGYWLYPYYDDPITLDVAGYGESDGGWVLIASPIAGSITTDYVTNLIGSMTPSGQYDFDLYRFNQSAPMEWENYHQHNNSYPDMFMLENGKGYLYANKNDVTLEFWGAAYPGSSKEVALDYVANSDFAGWNLVGNPFNAPATLDKSYYKMNTTGTGLVAEALSGNTPIDALTGVMVQAEGEDETVLFTKSDAKGQHETGFGTLQIALTQAGTRGNALLDNAIVSFNEGDELGKFYFGTQDANIYISKNHKEYAIAYAGNQTEMPLNFEAHENGEYTLTISAGDVIARSEATWQSTIGYLHLIDNLTGNDVDLLVTPSYTFTASTDDYASRFKLVFGEGAADDDDDFAFIDANGNIIINGIDGHATIQLIDLLGHVLVTSDVHSDFSLPTSDFPGGMYLLRLINGDNVKTQKIVVK